jgi:hypothetical protein
MRKNPVDSRVKNAISSQMPVQLPPQNGVSWGVRKFGWLLAVACAVSLTGCGAMEGVKQTVARETFAPTAATNNGVSVHVYLDRSGSAQDLRKDIGQQLLTLLDLYPDALETTLYWYSQDCKKINTTVASLTNLTPIVEDYVKDGQGDSTKVKGTLLVTAIKDLQTQAAREGSKQVIGVFVSDGGFEDDQSLLAKEVEFLRDVPNVSMLIFVGLDADGTQKLTVLDKVVRDKFVSGSGEGSKQFFDITLENGNARMSQAREAIKSLIQSTKSS